MLNKLSIFIIDVFLYAILCDIVVSHTMRGKFPDRGVKFCESCKLFIERTGIKLVSSVGRDSFISP